VTKKEKYKILVMVILLAISSFLTYYFHAVLRTGIVFTHFFYIPIILASLWWKRKGLIIVIFLAALLILSDVFITDTVPSNDDIPRIFMFMVVGFIVAVLSETIVKSDGLVIERTNELQESETKYRTLYESSSDAIMLLDENGFFDCNNATLKMFDFLKKEDYIKVHPAEVSPPYQPDGAESLNAANNKISEAFRKGMNSFEWLHRRKNGEDFPAEVLLTAFQLKGKQVLQATVRDITERKQAENELIKYREHLEELVKERTAELQKEIDERRLVEKKLREASVYTRSLIEASLDPLVTISPEGKITDVNKATESVTGVSRENLIGSDFSDYFTEPEKAREVYQQVFENGFVKDYPLAIRHGADGTTDVLYNVTVYRDAAGNVAGVFAAARDVTERKQVEEDLKKYRDHLEEQVIERTREVRLAKEDAEHANMAKTNFLHTMSHELRTPLNAVLGFSEMLKQRTFGELNEKQERFIDNIITGGNNLHNIISQILDVVKMDEGTLELHIEKIPMPEIVDAAIGVIKECATKKNVLLEKNLDPELEYIEVDKQIFKQVFINLLENAVKFSKQEGGNITITAKKEGDMARFSVSDKGIGIREDDVRKLFQKFTQLDSGTTRKYGGTGIGLAVTKQLVELHGGKIWAQSKYGEGSTFTFLLPIEAKKMGET
jgi:PAS domain S-box-containing protein